MQAVPGLIIIILILAVLTPGIIADEDVLVETPLIIPVPTENIVPDESGSEEPAEIGFQKEEVTQGEIETEKSTQSLIPPSSDSPAGDATGPPTEVPTRDPPTDTPTALPTTEPTEEVTESPSEDLTPAMSSLTPPPPSDTSGDSTETPVSESGGVTLGTIHITATGTELIPGMGPGYTFDGNYDNGQITISGSGSFVLQDDLHSSSIYAIRITAPYVTLDGNGKTVEGETVGGTVPHAGIDIPDNGFGGVTVQNFGLVTGFNFGIGSNAPSSTITGNTVSDNKMYGIFSSGGDATISNNIVNNNVDTGIYVRGDRDTITDNTATNHYYGIFVEQSDSAIISGNTANGNQIGIHLNADDATISDNIIRANNEGIDFGGANTLIDGNTIQNNPLGISGDGSSSTITRNTVSDSTTAGLDLRGSGTVYNNKFANTMNVAGSGVSSYTWNQAPASGTNVVGGPNIAGNYWSNPTSTGWSDQKDPNEAGYSTEPYEITSGVYDNTPLIGTVPTSTPTASPTPTILPTEIPTSLPTDEPTEEPTPVPTTTQKGNTDKNPPASPDVTIPSDVKVVLNSIVLPPDTQPGSRVDLSLILNNAGVNSLATNSPLILIPANDMAMTLGNQQASFASGSYDLSLPIQIPSLPGTYEYIFNPVTITKMKGGKEVQTSVGPPIRFIITVSPSGVVTVTMS